MTDHAYLLTGGGVGAIAVVRLCGPGVRAFLERHFSRPGQFGRCVHGELRDGKQVIDDPVVVWIAEQTADINLHAGTWVIHQMLELARGEGFSVEEPRAQEFPPEAMDGQTLLEREMLAALPLARTEPGVRILLEQPAAWEAFLCDVTSHEPSRVAQILSDQSLWHLLHPPRIAIIGAPNAGKSTLANQLFAQERSIVADLPGTTRDWVGEYANVIGLPVLLLDTPGIRPTPDPIEAQAIARAGEQIEQADLILLVLDVTQGLEEQRRLLDRYPGALLVLNKTDRPTTWDTAAFPRSLHMVASTGQGVDDLRLAITRHFGCLPSLPLGGEGRDEGENVIRQDTLVRRPHLSPLALTLSPQRERGSEVPPGWWTPRQQGVLERIVRDPRLRAELRPSILGVASRP